MRMKLAGLAALGMVMAAPVPAQQAEWQTPALPYGPVVPIPGASAERTGGEGYRVVFNVTHARPGDRRISGDLAGVARFVNLLAVSGMDPAASEIVAVVHGGATSIVVSDAAYLRRFGEPNPNAQVIRALEGAGVEVVVCGQALIGSGYTLEEVLEPVEVAISAMTVLADLQMQGYALMP